MEHTLKGLIYIHCVYLDGKHLSPIRSQEIYNHSPDGFSWGYAGSGPAQLALAICLELCKNKESAISRYQQFQLDIIAPLPQTDFETKFYF